jgi:hypothetical protein
MRITEKDLKEGEVICNKCKGTGSTSPANSRESIYYQVCYKCHGRGKLDWVEMIVGKKVDPWKGIGVPLFRKMYPKLIAQELFSVQPMDKPKNVEVFKCQKVDMFSRVLRRLQRLLTIFSKGKEVDGMTISPEKKLLHSWQENVRDTYIHMGKTLRIKRNTKSII